MSTKQWAFWAESLGASDILIDHLLAAPDIETAWATCPRWIDMMWVLQQAPSLLVTSRLAFMELFLGVLTHMGLPLDPREEAILQAVRDGLPEEEIDKLRNPSSEGAEARRAKLMEVMTVAIMTRPSDQEICNLVRKHFPTFPLTAQQQASA